MNGQKNIEIFKNNYSELSNVMDILKNMENNAYNELENDLVTISKKELEEISLNLNSVINSIKVIHEESIKDHKTGLYNMKFFYDFLKIELNRNNRNSDILGLVLLDIDYFKKVNDNFGHLIGDEILEVLANVIKKSFRDSDVVARFGGEEFIVLLTNTNLNVLKEIELRVRENIKKDEFLSKYKIELSAGVTFYKKNETIKDFISRCDKALYKAKKEGRNRFVYL